ncbi:MAG: MFS transporter [Chloroflexi bacterium]|nr:MFS transporter [Chloroflexota bacterium]MDA1297806.1 MFS transporter [Chloroflexota bacterium]
MKRTPFFYGWVIVGVSGLTVFFRNAAATLTIAVFVFPMAEDTGWTRTAIVGAASVAGVVSMFVSPLAGWVLQRFGPRVLLAGSMLVLGGAMMSIRWVDNIVMFYVLFGIGRVIFSSPVQIGSATVVAQWFVARRGRATSALGVMHSLGMGFFPLFAQVLMNASDGDWRMAWFWIGISVWAVALPPTLIALIRSPESVGLNPDGETDDAVSAGGKSATSAASEVQWTVREAMRTPAMWMLAVAGGLVFFIHTGVNIHQAAFLRDQGISASVAASALSVMAAGTALGSVMWGWLLERLPGRTVYALTAGWLGAVALLFLLVDSAPVAFVVAAAFGVGIGGLLVVPPVVMADYFGRRSLGAIRGITEPFVSGGQAVGGIAAGLIFDLSDSYSGTFPMFTVAALIGVALIILARRPIRPIRATAGATVAETAGAK